MRLPGMIAKTLGGKRVLGLEIRTELDLTKLIREGVEPAAINVVFDGILLTATDMERLVIPRRTLSHRINKGERLTREESDRLARIARIVALTDDTFGNRDKAAHWLRQPKRRFAGQTPIELLDTEEGARLVEDLLMRIAHGLAA